jgi:hypothetical protein
VALQEAARFAGTDDADELLAFYDYPCEHWVHMRTTNPIDISSQFRVSTMWLDGPWRCVADALS